MSQPCTPDIWLVLDRSRAVMGAAASAPPSATPSVRPEPTKWERAKKRAWSISLDGVATLWWAYVVLQLFVIDVQIILPGADVVSARSVATYRIVPLALITLLFGVFFWRWKALRALLYVAFFPFIVVFWKLPQLFIKARLYRNAVAIMAALNAATLAVQNLRYHLVSKSAAVLAVILIIFFDRPTLLLFGAVVVALLLGWSLVRVITQTFRSNTFVSSQRKLVTLAARVIDQPLQLDVATQPDGTATKQQVEHLASTIQSAAFMNRLLYLWAYKLQEYRESSFVVVFNGLSYASLFLGSTIAFFLLNLAVLKSFPGQYSFQSHPSAIAVFLYALSSMAFADGGGIAASGDIAYILRILAGVYGPGFLLTVVVNTLAVLRGSREDTELRNTVQDLKRRARKHEANFQQSLQVGIDEACDRLVRLGIANLLGGIRWVEQAIPPGFMGGDSGDGEMR